MPMSDAEFLNRDTPPDGFRRMANRPAFEAQAGPFYERQLPDGTWQLGMRVTPDKLNPKGVCHGGVLATFADVQTTLLIYRLGIVSFTPTVNLTLDYVAGARAGTWVQSTPEIVRRTSALLFCQAVLTADGEPCLRSSGIFRIFGP